MRKAADSSLICDYHPDYRVAAELDALNLNVRIPREQAVPYPKPQDYFNPYTFLEEEGHLLGFVGQMVTAGERYLNVTSGAGSALDGSETLATYGWSAYYLYGLIAENKRPRAMLDRAETLLGQIAVAMQARQVGFGVSTSSTRANNSAWGAFLESGATVYQTEDAILGGLALLYAYRRTSSMTYLLGARAAASYLRNVQAIGKYGVNRTSTDAAGTGYLYTGSLCSQVSTAAGFYSDHLFYPSALMALVFWRALQATDGDQQIGATAAVAGEFSQVPQQLLSTCVDDLRACWQNGIKDSTNTTINGLSATTPREYFNAYPQTKPHFSVNGTGRWEFYDGPAATGTEITGESVAKALHALYAYEGASDQVAALDDWLRGFTSNADFETPTNTSISALARSTTGTYEPTKAITTLLLVRDADDDYSAIATNGSSLYDWGATGLLSHLRAARHNNEFAAGRRYGCYTNQRWKDGQATDGNFYDPLIVMGRSGLTRQTAFGGTGNTPQTPGAGDFTDPVPGMFWWGIGDTGVTLNGSDEVTRWEDQSPYGRDVIDCASNGGRPHVADNVLAGRSAIRFSRIIDGNRFLESEGLPFTIQPTDPLTVYTVCVPRNSTAGTLFAANGEGDTVPPNRSFMIYRDGGGTQYAAADFSGPDCITVPTVDYTGVPIIVAHYSEYNSGTGLIDVWCSVNGSALTLSHSTMLTGSARDRFFVGGYFMTGGLFQGGADVDMLEQIAYTSNTRASDGDAQNMTYFRQQYFGDGVPPAYTVRDGVRAPQVGLWFRDQPVAQRLPGT